MTDKELKDELKQIGHRLLELSVHSVYLEDTENPGLFEAMDNIAEGFRHPEAEITDPETREALLTEHLHNLERMASDIAGEPVRIVSDKERDELLEERDELLAQRDKELRKPFDPKEVYPHTEHNVYLNELGERCQGPFDYPLAPETVEVESDLTPSEEVAMAINNLVVSLNKNLKEFFSKIKRS